MLAISESWLYRFQCGGRNRRIQAVLTRSAEEETRWCVCVYIRTSRMAKAKVLKELCAISDSKLWLEIQHKKLKVILLCVVYRPPDCSVSCFGDDFMENYMHALTFGNEILVTGDQNWYILSDCSEAHSLAR